MTIFNITGLNPMPQKTQSADQTNINLTMMIDFVFLVIVFSMLWTLVR